MHGKSAFADLLRATAVLDLNPGQERAAARLLGLIHAEPPDLPQPAPATPPPSLPAQPAQTPKPAAESDATPKPEPPVEPHVDAGEDTWIESLPSERPAPPAWLGEVGEFPLQSGDWMRDRPMTAPPLLPTAWARRALAEILSHTPSQGPLDIARLIPRLARRQPVKRLPLLRCPRLANSAQVLVDNGDGMAPFRDDQRDLLSHIRQLVPRSALRVLYFESSPQRGVRAEREILDSPYPLPPRGSAVLVLSDLGRGGDARPQDREWHDWAADLTAHRCKLATLIPYPPERLPTDLRDSLGIILWERPTPPPFRPLAANLLGPLTAEQRGWAEDRPEALHLALYLSLVARIEPALLRVVRHRFVPTAPAAAEADLWHSPLIDDRSRLFVSIEPSAAEGLRGLLRQYPEQLAEIHSIIKNIHHYLPPLAQMEEELLYLATAQPPDFRAQIDACVRPLLMSLIRQPERREALAAWCAANLPRLPKSAGTTSVWSARAMAHLTLQPDEPMLIDPDDEIGAIGGKDTAYFWSQVRRIPVAISHRDGWLQLSDGDNESQDVSLPSTKPRVMDLIVDGRKAERLTWVPGGVAQARGPLPIMLRALDGTGCRLAKYRVFVSYDTEDAALALDLAQALQARGLDPWLDQWHLPPGEPWLKVLETAFKDFNAVAVLIGPNGSGPFQEQEMAAALQQTRAQGKPVIPVLLKDAAPLPSFLAQYGYVDLRRGLDATAIDRLIWGIGAARRVARYARPKTTEWTLTVYRNGEVLAARWDSGTPIRIDIPLTKSDLDELGWYLDRYIEFPSGGDRSRAKALEVRFDDWGRSLRQALFDGVSGNRVYQEIRNHLAQGERVLLTIASDIPAFLIRPWEMLRDDNGLLVMRGLTLRRRSPGTRSQIAFALGLPLRVLLVVSRPVDTGFMDPRTSTRPVLDALAPFAGQVEINFCEPPTLAKLERLLSDALQEQRPYHIVHFDGHGQYDPLTGVGALCFEDDDRRADMIAGTQLGDLLSRLQVPLVLLEACRGAQVSDRPIFGSVAPALLESGVGSVVAFSHSVHVAAATLLVESLYRELVAGASISEALGTARAALHANRRRWLSLGPDPETVEIQDWIIPQLYQSGIDSVLVPGGAFIESDGGRHPTPTNDVMLPGFPPAPRYRFHGRARELLDLERALDKHNAILLYGGGGMGKTALTREAAHWWLRTGRFERGLFHSFEHGAGAEQVVQLLGESLAGDDFVLLAADAQWAEAVRLFRQRRVLLVWDNYECVLPAFVDEGSYGGSNSHDAAPVGSGTRADLGATPKTAGDAHNEPYEAFDAAARADLEQLYRELTTGEPKGRLLVTCRPAETGLDGIHELRLVGLARPDTLHLLHGVCERQGIDLERAGYDREEIEALLDRLEDHPLSIELVAPHLKDLKPRTIREELSQRLAQFQDPGHAESRNRSLLASLDFSRRRLSPAARSALAWLGWFQGGVFQRSFLAFSQIPEDVWAPIRAELTATALLRVEDLTPFDTCYLRLHPTLADAVRADVTDGDLAGRFVAIYLELGGMIDQALDGAEPATGMTLTWLEQPNLRRAMELAFRQGRYREGAGLGRTLGAYLERAGRLRERNRLAAWIRERMTTDRLDGATCGAIRAHAWSLFAQGQAQEAMALVQDLERLIATGALADGDPARESALTRQCLGRILDHAGRSDLAVTPLGHAIAALRALGDDDRDNLSAALGDLAHALMTLGEYDRALAAADEALALAHSLGRYRDIAVGLGQTAAILMHTGRYGEAESRFRDGLEAAERAADLGLQSSLMQRLGILQRETGRAAESVDTLRRVLRSFQQSGDRGGEVRTCDLLGTAEQDLGRLDMAEAWYHKAISLAQALGDRHQIGITRENLAMLQQVRAESAADPTERHRLLAEAVTEIESSLVIKLEMGNRLGEAVSRFQLGVLCRLLGDLDRAEAEARQALAIREPLNHPDTWKDCASLAEIARVRGDQSAATDWQARADALRATFEGLAAAPKPAMVAVNERGPRERATGASRGLSARKPVAS